MKIIITVRESETEIKKAIAKGWNERFDEDLTFNDVKVVGDRDDILCAIPYISAEKIEIKVE